VGVKKEAQKKGKNKSILLAQTSSIAKSNILISIC
jgi:hypothetical protein